MRTLGCLFFLLIQIPAWAMTTYGGQLHDKKGNRVLALVCTASFKQNCEKGHFALKTENGEFEVINWDLGIALGSGTADFQSREYYFTSLKQQAFMRFSPIPFPVYMANTRRAGRAYEKFYDTIRENRTGEIKLGKNPMSKFLQAIKDFEFVPQ